MLGEKDLEYLGTMVLLATRGGAITEHDIDKAIKLSKHIFKRVFEDSKE